MKSQRQLGWIITALLLLALSPGILFGQSGENSGIPTNIDYPSNPNGPSNAGAPANDPPSRVARVQYISGEVSMQPGGVNDWVAASLNSPLTTSDRVWTDKDSRAELNVGSGFIRLNSESSLTLTNVSDNTVQMQLDQGTLELTVRHLEPGEIFEIDTPNLAFTVMKAGVYRIDVPPNENQTWVTVRKGSGQATGQGPAVKVNSGEQVRFTGQGSLQNAAYAAPAPDGFDDWAQVRDKRLDSSVSARYVAPGVIGYEDLDYYGTWRVVPTYGAIWVPTSVAVGWAPYRYGHWAWVAPWGWTWVDNAPWGFAPFHYGRWVNYGGGWGWAPGPVYVGWRPYYAPALVAWVGGAGWGFGVSFGVGFGVGGGCGWFPLGWGEPYYPWYHGYHGGYVSNTYIRNVNVTNTRINNINVVSNNYYHGTMNNTHYVNRNVAGAVTAAPKSALANGQNIARYGTAVPRADLNKGEVLRSANVTPSRGAELYGHAPTTAGVPPQRAFDRPVVTHNGAPTQAANQQPAGTHNVPAPPASLGVHNPAYGTATQAAGAPRPQQNTGSNSAYASQAGSQHVVPKPPYAGGHAPTATEAANRNYGSAYPSVHPSTQGTAQSHEATHASPSASPTYHNQKPAQNNNKESKPKEAPKGNPGMASANVPRPPAGYSYHAAPGATASSYAGGNSYGGGSRSYSANASAYAGNRSSYSASASPYAGNRSSYSASAPTYTGNRSTYSAPATTYHTGGGEYSAAPRYSARASAPPLPHSSATSYSGGGRSSSGSGHSSSSGGHSGGSHR
jgi:hypothetical protein